jgi:crossover junction endodeoxyribonuclease RusA
MAILELTLYGDPIPKGRPRLGKNGHAHTPERTRSAERAAIAMMMVAMAGQPIADVPVGIAVEFFCATNRKTDGDNLLKLITDAMNEIVVTDDSLIEEWFCRVHRGVGKANARTEILVYLLPEYDTPEHPITSG